MHRSDRYHRPGIHKGDHLIPKMILIESFIADTGHLPIYADISVPRTTKEDGKGVRQMREDTSLEEGEVSQVRSGSDSPGKHPRGAGEGARLDG